MSSANANEYITVSEAARQKYVAPNTLYRLLRNDIRREKYFPRTLISGEGRHTNYRMHVADVTAWQPANTKPVKK